MITDILVLLAVAAILVGILLVWLLKVRDDQTWNRAQESYKKAKHIPLEVHEYYIEENPIGTWEVHCSSCSWEVRNLKSYAGAELEGELHAPTQ